MHHSVITETVTTYYIDNNIICGYHKNSVEKMFIRKRLFSTSVFWINNKKKKKKKNAKEESGHKLTGASFRQWQFTACLVAGFLVFPFIK